MLIIAMIPFNKIEKMVYWLGENVKYGGWLPRSPQAYYQYLNKAFDCVSEKVNESIKRNNPCCVIVDESTDKLHRPALDIVIKQSEERPILIDIIEMQRVNSNTVAQNLLECLGRVKYPYNNVIAFVSDGASYMKKAWVQTLGNMFPYSTFVICYSHCLNLIVSDIINDDECDLAFTFMSAFREYFSHSYLRINRFISCQVELGENNPTKPLQPSNTRWDSWDAVIEYHISYWKYFNAFFMSEVDINKSDGFSGSNTSPKSLLSIITVIQDKDSLDYFKVMFFFQKKNNEKNKYTNKKI
jgi:hypothetical protein